MSHLLKIASVALAVVFGCIAVAIGGGAPLSPAAIANATSDAARNVKVAEENTAEAARDTEDLAVIARNVKAQHATSTRMLDIQLSIEDATRDAASSARELNVALAGIGEALRRVESDLGQLSELASLSGSTVDATALRAAELQQVIDLLQARFVQVTRQSRELNRKARGYQEVRDGPDG